MKVMKQRKIRSADAGTAGLVYDLLRDRSAYACTDVGICQKKRIRIARIYNGKPVTTIGWQAFSDCRDLIGVTVPEGVTEIGYLAFLDCVNLKRIKISKSVKIVGEESFRGCSSLKKITIPDGVERIGEGAFRRCVALKSVTVGRGVTDIGEYALEDCGSLAGVRFMRLDGWRCIHPETGEERSFSAQELSDPCQAAKYFTETYRAYTWKRN